MTQVATQPNPAAPGPGTDPVKIAAPGAAAAPAEEKLLAGKYKNHEEMFAATNQIRKEIGLAELKGDLIGPGKMFADVLAAETYHKEQEHIFGKLHAKPREEAAPAPKPGEIPSVANPPPKPAEPGAADLTFNEVVEKSGLSARDLYDQISKDGKLTDAQYAKLKEAGGWSKKAADDRVLPQATAWQANKQLVYNTLVAASGGEPQLLALVAAANIRYKDNPAAAKDIDRRLGDPALAAGVIKQLKMEYAEETNSNGSVGFVSGGQPAPAGAGGKITDPKEMLTIYEKVKSNTATAEEIRRFNQSDNNLLLKA